MGVYFTSEISFAGIIDENGNPFYTYERSDQGSSENSNWMFSNFVQSLQLFAKSLGENDVNTITLGDYKIYAIKDNLSNMVFFLRSEITAKSKKVNRILCQMRNIFIEKFLGNLNATEDRKRELLNSFSKDLMKVLKEKENSIEKLLEET